jgi:hypothetical protein
MEASFVVRVNGNDDAADPGVRTKGFHGPRDDRPPAYAPILFGTLVASRPLAAAGRHHHDRNFRKPVVHAAEV